MPTITRALLRKRAEHNEGMISTLEEISLHQEELESINEVLGMTCRKLKILYLQNNIIFKMENLYHMKDLVYLNLALNNISKIEGLQNCEFLRKLDLTVNFVDLDELKNSIEHLQSRENLQELYMMGNPAEHSWENFKHYVIAKLPQLQTLDGTEITKSMQIQARQKLPALEVELEKLAKKVRLEKAEKAAKAASSTSITTASASTPAVTKGDVTVEDVDEEVDQGGDGPEELTENTPEARVKIYQELAQQKKEKEDRANVNAPKKRDYEAEQAESIQATRVKEAEVDVGEIKQKNEGGWEFYWDEESRPGVVVLEVRVQKFLDSSLIDVDVHPTYVSMIIKSKVLRLRLPAEVKVSESKCQRSKTNGSLMIIMPKVNAHENSISLRGDQRAREAQQIPTLSKPAAASRSAGTAGAGSGKASSASTANRTVTKPKKLSLAEQILLEAQSAGAEGTQTAGLRSGGLLDANIGAPSKNAVNVANIVPRKEETHLSDTMVDQTVFNMSNRVVELD